MGKPGTALVVVRKHKIKPERKLLLRTICEVMRELYRDAEKRKDTLSMVRLEEAHDMAKRMQRKLEEYNPKAPYITTDGERARR